MSEQRQQEPLDDLAQIAERVNSEHRLCREALAASTKHALRVGRLLLKAKSQCKHGFWLTWLEEHVEFSARTAQEYMRLARVYSGLDPANAQRVAQASFRGAIQMVAAIQAEEVGQQHEGNKVGESPAVRQFDLVQEVPQAAEPRTFTIHRPKAPSATQAPKVIELHRPDAPSTTVKGGPLPARRESPGDGVLVIITALHARCATLEPETAAEQPWPEEQKKKARDVLEWLQRCLDAQQNTS